MDNKQLFELECRMAAMEHLIKFLVAAQCERADVLAGVMRSMKQTLSTQTMSGVDPVQSDLAVAQIEEEIERILHGSMLMLQGK